MIQGKLRRDGQMGGDIGGGRDVVEKR